MSSFMSKGGKAELLTFFYCLPLHYLVFAVMKLVRGGLVRVFRLLISLASSVSDSILVEVFVEDV